MSSRRFEAFLAHLYGDEVFAAHFIEQREVVLARSDLDEQEREALRRIDLLELSLACRSFAAKRAAHRRPTLLRRLLRRPRPH